MAQSEYDSMADLGGPSAGWTFSDLDRLYQQYLGRSASEADYAAHKRNPQGLTGVTQAILSSPEYRQRQTTGPTSPTTPAPTTTTTTGGAVSGWGFDSPTGGKKAFTYTPQTYSGGWGNFYGFRDMDPGNFDEAAYGSAKYVVARAAQGLGEGPNGFDEAGVDELVRRLNAQGIPAKKVDAYQIDLGLGEGPIQVRHSSNKVWWNNRATESLPATTSPTAPAATTPVSSTPGERVGEAVPGSSLPPGTTFQHPTTGEPVTVPTSAFVAQTVAPYFAAQGIEVLEVNGNRMRVLTAEDKAQGRTYGRWVDLLLPGGGNMADLGQARA